MGNQANSIWTEALIADLVRLWDRGYSCAQIAAIIGVTRNAVIGKAHRLQLPTHRDCNVNGQKRVIDPRPEGSPRAKSILPRHRPGKTVFQSRERKPRARIINPDSKPAIMSVISTITGQMISIQKYRRQRLDHEMTKDEMRAMLSAAMRNTASLGVS
jgi:hypothetical protein